ncbi:MAG: hypothetical protein Q4G16_02945 [Cruoricaptor ignavus]|nr:hypothetical protein [Cruoricaptor ignavus]
MKTILITLLGFILIQCNSQEKKDNQILPKSDGKIVEINNMPEDQFLIGTWRLKDTSASESNLNLNTKCTEKTLWVFTDKNTLSIQKSSGTECEKQNTTNAKVMSFGNGELIYRLDDIVKPEKFSQISDNEFQLISKDYIGGNFVEIKKTFIRK